MAVRKYKPTTPGRRGASVSSFEEVTRGTPKRSLLDKGRKKAGRNNKGLDHDAAPGRRQQAAVPPQIDFRRNKDGVPAKVAHIEYDPNRTARIALLHHADGEKRYILAPQGVQQGDQLMSRAPTPRSVPATRCRCATSRSGTVIHAIEMKPGAGAKLARSAGTSVQLMAKEGSMATLRLPSGEMRLIPAACKGTVGVVGNPEHELISLGKAGRARWKNQRPTVRGVAMNPVDHPLGGGEGQVLRWPAPGVPLGQEGRPHAQEEQGVEQVHRPPPWEGSWLACRGP